jgi:hypothetical protein
MSLRGHSTISRTYGANWLAESKGLIASGLITIKLKRGICQAFSSPVALTGRSDFGHRRYSPQSARASSPKVLEIKYRHWGFQQE